MEHDVVIRYESKGWRIYFDDAPRPGHWLSDVDLRYAKNEAESLAKQYKLKEYRIIDMHRYEKIIKVDYDNE